jgi:hypothetical protein
MTRTRTTTTAGSEGCKCEQCGGNDFVVVLGVGFLWDGVGVEVGAEALSGTEFEVSLGARVVCMGCDWVGTVGDLVENRKREIWGKLEAAFEGEFMQPCVTSGVEKWWKVETDFGVWFVPFEFDVGGEGVGEWVEGEVIEKEVVRGYGARLSAAGYMDATEWGVCDTWEEAVLGLLELYGTERAEGSE